MNIVDVTMVRVYLAEGRKDLMAVEKWLQEKSNIHGYTVFRGIEGVGRDGHRHKASFIDLSSELPIVIEFFGLPEQVDVVLEQLQKLVRADRIVSWPAKSGI